MEIIPFTPSYLEYCNNSFGQCMSISMMQKIRGLLLRGLGTQPCLSAIFLKGDKL